MDELISSVASFKTSNGQSRNQNVEMRSLDKEQHGKSLEQMNVDESGPLKNGKLNDQKYSESNNYENGREESKDAHRNPEYRGNEEGYADGSDIDESP